MFDQENFNMQVQRQIDAQNEQIKAFVKGLDDFKTEMRDRDNQRAAEIRALRAETDAKLTAMQSATDSKIEKIEQKMDALANKIEGIGNHVRNLAITAMIGIVAMGGTIVYNIVKGG